MLVISFDIGIKNLAYCLFSLSPTDIQIVKWGIANLMPQENTAPALLCCKCVKKACITYANNPYCKVHAKKTGGTPVAEIPKYKSLKKDELVKLMVALKIPCDISGVKQDLVDAADTYYKQHAIIPIKPTQKPAANQIHLVTIGTNIKLQMDTVLQGLPPIDIVILENQISPIAGRMNTIQGMLAQYFIMQGNCPRIEFIASSGKLKDFKNNISGTEYKNHKEDGIKFCKMLLQSNKMHFKNNEENVLDMAQKKDDLADCFLQGVYFLKREKIISYSENLEIKLVG